MVDEEIDIEGEEKVVLSEPLIIKDDSEIEEKTGGTSADKKDDTADKKAQKKTKKSKS
ncbi:MAG: hypothetical protein QW728_00190 [Thermoplasmata archaeon]